MAATATGITIQPILDSTQSTQIVRGSIALSGNYGATSPSDTNGDILSLAVYPTQSATAPIRVFIYEEPAAGVAPTGYTFLYAKGTDPTNGELVVLQGAGGAVSGLTATTTMTTTTNASTAAPVYVTGGAVTQAAGVAAVTGFTTTIAGGGSSAGGPAGQITRGAAYPGALVTAAAAGYLKFEAVFPLGQ